MWPRVSRWSHLGVSSDYAGSTRVLSIRTCVPIWARVSGSVLVSKLGWGTRLRMWRIVAGATVEHTYAGSRVSSDPRAAFSSVWNVVVNDEKSASERCDMGE